MRTQRSGLGAWGLAWLGLMMSTFLACSDASPGLLAPHAPMDSQVQDPECPETIGEKTGTEATNCTDRAGDYGRVRNEVSWYVDFNHPTCIEAWHRSRQLMDENNVFGYDHPNDGWWEGAQSPADKTWVNNFLWDMDVYRSNFYRTLLHEAGHSLYGSWHGQWEEEIDGCIEW